METFFNDVNKDLRENGSPIDENKWKEHLEKKPFCSPISEAYKIKGHFCITEVCHQWMEAFLAHVNMTDSVQCEHVICSDNDCNQKWVL